MKPIKMFGLAALAALLAMAFAGASSAMAESTALCKADESTCSEANSITHVHETTSTKAKLLSENEIECNVLFLGDTTPGDTAARVISGTFTYSSCTNTCTVKEENGPAAVYVLKAGAELASVTYEYLIHFKCFFGLIDCSYNGEGLEGHAVGPLNGGGNGSVTIEEQETTKESGSAACESEAFLDIKTSPLEATYISAWLGYCVQTLHTNGLYTDENCSTLGSTPPRHEYKFTLVWAWPDWGLVGDTRCYDTLSRKGLYKTYRLSGLGCLDDESQRIWLYENGKITVVE